MELSDEEIIPLSLYNNMLDESMSSDIKGVLSLSISSEGSSRYGSKEEFDIDDSFWKFINESKYPQKEKKSEEDSEPIDEREDEKRNNEEEDEKNEDTNLLMMVMMIRTRIFYSSDIHLILSSFKSF